MGETYVELSGNSAVHFTCRACTANLSLGNPDFKITRYLSGTHVEPQWVCPECGVYGEVRRGEARVLGRVTGALGAIRSYAALVADRDEEPVKGIVFEEPKKVVDEGCPEKTRHAVFTRRGEGCPVCDYISPSLLADSEEE